MPALEVFGRRSRVVGSDDLYCPALFLMLYQLPLALGCVLYASLWRRCSSMTLDDSGLPFWYMLGAVPLLGFMACIYLIVMHVAAKGTIVDHERRMLMPRVLHVHTLWSAVLLGYGVLGICCWYYREMCDPDAHFVLGLGACLVAQVSFTSTLGFCILSDVPQDDALEKEKDHPPVPTTLDPYGNAIACERQSLLDDVERTIPSSDVYVPHRQHLWKQRCTRCCTCMRCFTCNLFGGAGTRHDSMSVVANVFSRLFYGSPDLVISDIIAGFILLAAVQAHEENMEVIATSPHRDADEEGETLGKLRARLRASRQNTSSDSVDTTGVATSATVNSNASLLSLSSVDAEEATHHVVVNVPPTSAEVEDRQEAQPFYYHPSDPHLRDTELASRVEELAHFSRYAIGIYGWMLYIWSHPWSGSIRLALSCLRRNLPYVHGDNWFHLGQTALQLETKVRADAIVYASFHNSVYQPAFAVVLDHERREVVVAIRGTLSLEDCLTDAIAYGVPMDGVADRWGCEGCGEYAHQGFLTCAESVYLELNRLGILEMLFDDSATAVVATDVVNECERGAYSDYGLVVTGHSLGAGTAVLLAVLLRPKYPQLRCFAFSPPGCTMSPALAKRCADFTTSVVVGDDIIARSSLTSAEALRDQVLDLIGRSKVNKAAILRQVVAWRSPDELLYRPGHHERSSFDAEDEQGNMERRELSPFMTHLSNYRTMLQRIQASEPINELTVPGRLIHLKRVVRAKGVGGCWVCCRPGGGGVCCTARTNYRFAWAAEGQFDKIRIGRTMLDDHFPDKVHYVLEDCVKRMKKSKQECL